MKQVSVIVPNYNYSKYLKRRLDSIINQTIKPSEIIFLDDFSTDDSLVIAIQILDKCDIPYRIIANESNQGVFKQWLKGIKLIQYNYFWIAEADDYCEANFLETLLQSFDDESVVLSYCKSNFVNKNGVNIASEDDYKLQYFDVRRWGENYINDAENEVLNFLSLINTIPNASAVIFNKSRIDLEQINTISQFSKSGDWIFYLICLCSFEGNKIAYHVSALNFYVRHEASVFGPNLNKSVFTEEVFKIYVWVLTHIKISVQIKQHIITEVFWRIGEFIDSMQSEILLRQIFLLLGIPNTFIFSYIKGIKDMTQKINWLEQINAHSQAELENCHAELETCMGNLRDKDNEVFRIINPKPCKLIQLLSKINSLIKRIFFKVYWALGLHGS